VNRTPGGVAVDIIAVVDHVDAAGFHAIDMALQDGAAQIEPGWAGAVRNARIAVAVLDWPEPLRAASDAFLAAAADLTAALTLGEPASASAAARRAHGTQHRLSNASWEYLAHATGIEAAGATPHAHEHH
jgi:hypothetical protein